MLTADTITDEQIREAFYHGLVDVDTAHVATIHDAWPAERHAARARCAEILNARTTKEP
jgi:hypothetical protein